MQLSKKRLTFGGTFVERSVLSDRETERAMSHLLAFDTVPGSSDAACRPAVTSTVQFLDAMEEADMVVVRRLSRSTVL